jgi:hypothetical protein
MCPTSRKIPVKPKMLSPELKYTLFQPLSRKTYVHSQPESARLRRWSLEDGRYHQEEIFVKSCVQGRHTLHLSEMVSLPHKSRVLFAHDFDQAIYQAIRTRQHLTTSLQVSSSTGHGLASLRTYVSASARRIDFCTYSVRPIMLTLLLVWKFPVQKR